MNRCTQVEIEETPTHPFFVVIKSCKIHIHFETQRYAPVLSSLFYQQFYFHLHLTALFCSRKKHSDNHWITLFEQLTRRSNRYHLMTPKELNTLCRLQLQLIEKVRKKVEHVLFHALMQIENILEGEVAHVIR